MIPFSIAAEILTIVTGDLAPDSATAAMEKGINPEDPGRHHHKWMEKEEVDFQASEWYQRASCSRRDTVEEVASVLFQSISDTRCAYGF